MDNLSFSDRADATVERARPRLHDPEIVHADLATPAGMILLGGKFQVECVGPDGETRWADEAKNLVTNAGLNAVLSLFSGTAFPTTFVFGLVDNAGFTAFANADTMASHPGWSEVATSAYSDTTRVAWGAGVPSSLAITNATTADHHMTPSAALTVKGLFLTTDATKGGTAGTLISEAAFTGGTQVCNGGDTLKVTYVLSAATN